MKAIILVGGEGTRLRPMTCNCPKPMIPVANKPFLVHVFDYLKMHGITDIILSMGYRSEVIENYFGDGSDFGINLIYVLEDKPLGTAGAAKNAEKYLDGTCFIFNGDILTDLDLNEMLKYHREKEAKVTIALTPVEDPTQYGLVERTTDGRIERFIEKPSWDRVTTNMINAGTYIVEPDVFRYVPPAVNYSFEHGLFLVLLQTSDPMYAYPSNAYWIDIGTPSKYITVHHDILLGQIKRPLSGEQIEEGVTAGEGCKIHPSAKLRGPILLGENVIVERNAVINGPAVIGDCCVIGAESIIEDAVIWKNTTIHSRVMLKKCVIAQDSIIEDGTWITDGAIVGDNVRIGSGNRLQSGIRIWSGKTIEPNAITF